MSVPAEILRRVIDRLQGFGSRLGVVEGKLGNARTIAEQAARAEIVPLQATVDEHTQQIAVLEQSVRDILRGNTT